MQTRLNYRVAVVALLVGVLAGLFGAASDPRADAQTAPEPQPIKVAYVDFLGVFKDEPKLKADQRRIAAEAETQLQAIDESMAPKVDALEKDRKLYEPHDQRHWAAMQSLLRAQREYNVQRLDVESRAQAELRDAAIDSYKRLRTLVTDLATKRGYNQVVNVVRNPEKIAEASEDFRVLQQQLLISPVIYFDKDHDLTDLLAAETKRMWGIAIEIKVDGAVLVDAQGKDGAEVPKVAQGDENKERIDFRLKLGETMRVKTTITNNGQPAEGTNAGLAWTRLGLKSGEVKDTGVYTAPAECPSQSDIITVRVRSLVDSTTVDIRIKLLDKDGKEIDLAKLNKEREEAERKKSSGG